MKGKVTTNQRSESREIEGRRKSEIFTPSKDFVIRWLRLNHQLSVVAVVAPGALTALLAERVSAPLSSFASTLNTTTVDQS